MGKIEQSKLLFFIVNALSTIVAALIIFPLFDLIMTNFTSETFQYNVGDHIIEPIILGILFGAIMTFFQFRKKKTKKNSP